MFLCSQCFLGVSNCYVFKSRLQEYCQKAGLTTPVYETIKEGPSHEPSFKSAVTVNNFKYDSLPGFFNRKAAEQSAAEVALIELGRTNYMNFGISQPVVIVFYYFVVSFLRSFPLVIHINQVVQHKLVWKHA